MQWYSHDPFTTIGNQETFLQYFLTADASELLENIEMFLQYYMESDAINRFNLQPHTVAKGLKSSIYNLRKSSIVCIHFGFLFSIVRRFELNVH